MISYKKLLIGIFRILFLLVFFVGILFRIQHWPGGLKLFFSGQALFAATFVPGLVMNRLPAVALVRIYCSLGYMLAFDLAYLHLSYYGKCLYTLCHVVFLATFAMNRKKTLPMPPTQTELPL